MRRLSAAVSYSAASCHRRCERGVSIRPGQSCDMLGRANIEAIRSGKEHQAAECRLQEHGDASVPSNSPDLCGNPAVRHYSLVRAPLFRQEGSTI